VIETHPSLGGANNGMKLVLVGQFADEHLGFHLSGAARDLGLDLYPLDASKAYAGSGLQRRANWWLRGRRPNRLASFSGEVERCCREVKPDFVLTTGLAPVEAAALRQIRAMGAITGNYLTDDPWNAAHRAAWFLEALPCYDHVFSPRRATLDDLHRAGCPSVHYLPFAYAPDIHHPEEPTPEERAALSSDIIFAGGADSDRLPYIVALSQAGFQIALYGGFWERFAATRDFCRGKASPALLRKAIRASKIALCLVRRANRDGHSMRTFEVPAVGAALLMENTGEHRDLFGPEGQAALYFDRIPEMTEKARWLLDHDEDRERMAEAARRIVTGGAHTYHDRLRQMLQLAGAPVRS
jgi:spore maturation protein CgeB